MAAARRRTRSYKRGPSKREPGALLRIYITTPKTAELSGYLQALMQEAFDIKNRLIEVFEPDSKLLNEDVFALVSDVAKKKTSDEARFKRDNERYTKVDEWWIVADTGFSLDRDQQEKIDDAIKLADDAEIRLLLNNPSFEYWALLHACFMSRQFDRPDDLVSVLFEKLKEAKCDIFPSSLIKRLSNAMVNSAALRTEAAQGGDCASVNFDILVDRLAKYANKATNKALKLPADNMENAKVLASKEVVKHAARLCWRGIRQEPEQSIVYELRLYDSVLATIDVKMDRAGKRSYEIVDVIDNDRLLPLPFANDKTGKGFKSWLETRTIPQGQQYARGVLEKAGVDVRDIFSQIELGFGLSLSDAYWVAPQGLGWTWAYVNLYDSDVNDSLSMSIYDPKRKIEVSAKHFSNEKKEDDYLNISPAYGAGGSFKKAWYKNRGVYVLRKSGSERLSANEGQEPWSEYVASQVAEAMGIEHVTYGLDYYQGELVSTCELLNSEVIALVPAVEAIGDNNGDFFSTMASFAALGEDALDAFRDMIVFDCLICNTDRHANNHGFLRDNSTGLIYAIAPLFDHNYSLFPCDLPSDYPEWRTGERPYNSFNCQPRLTDAGKWMTFDEQATYVLGHNQRERLRKLLGPGVRLCNVAGKAAVPEDRLDAWQEFITVRANQLLAMKTVDDRTIRSIIQHKSIKRSGLPAVKLGLIGEKPLRRAKPEN